MGPSTLPTAQDTAANPRVRRDRRAVHLGGPFECARQPWALSSQRSVVVAASQDRRRRRRHDHHFGDASHLHLSWHARNKRRGKGKNAGCMRGSFV